MRVRFRPAALWNLLKESIAEWSRDKALRLGAALSFYAVLSLPSLLVIVVTVAAVVFGREAAQTQIVEQFGGLVGEEGGRLIETMLTGGETPRKGIFASLLAGLLLLFGATGAFAELQDSLNVIWNVKTKPRGGVWGLIRTRVLSLNLVLAAGFLLIVSLTVSAALAALGEFWGSRFEGLEFALKTIDFILSFGVLTVLFAVLFRRLPDIDIPWRDVWLGSAVTSLLFTLGKFAIGLYLGKSAVAASYGAAGPLVILLLWIYYSSLIFFFGAEFTQVYSRTYGSRVGKATDKEESQTTGVLPVGKGPAGSSSKAPAPPKTLMPIPVPAEVWTRERLRADLQSSQQPGSADTGWGRYVFAGSLIFGVLVVAVRLTRR
jgi:membrane protein